MMMFAQHKSTGGINRRVLEGALILCFAIVSHASLAASGNSTDVRVRLVYLSNGKPATNQEVVLYEGDPQNKATAKLSGRTRSDGTVTFTLLEPQSDTLWVYLENGRIISCAWEPQLSVKTVVEKGITIIADSRFGQKCKGDRSIANQLAAKPGEIVIFVRKLTTRDNLTHY